MKEIQYRQFEGENGVALSENGERHGIKSRQVETFGQFP
jgi:hypothetical protein